MILVSWRDICLLYTKSGYKLNPLGPIAPKVALLTSYFFVASHFETKFAHELVVLFVVC